MQNILIIYNPNISTKASTSASMSFFVVWWEKETLSGVVLCWTSSVRIFDRTDDGLAAPELQALPCETAIPLISNCSPINGFIEGKERLKTFWPSL